MVFVDWEGKWEDSRLLNTRVWLWFKDHNHNHSCSEFNVLKAAYLNS
jgi:hypothetical protein